MDKKIFLRFKPVKETYIAFCLLIIAILANTIANIYKGSVLYYFLYHGVFVLGTCIFLPLWYFCTKSKESMAEIGLTIKGWKKALLVGLVFVLFSVPWRIIGKDLNFPQIVPLTYTIIGLVMSTLFEEVFFRGYLQTRFEKAFGIIPAIVLSGASFSIYHIGYSDFRSLSLLITLFFVGIFFACVFRITNNVITAFVINLPHAIVTFIEKGITLNSNSAIISATVTIIAVVIIIGFAKIRQYNKGIEYSSI